VKICPDALAKATAPGSESGIAGERHSPREHMRRGHYRTYRSGKRIWVEGMTVNRGKGGRIDKDYVIT
jgi:hypothetical protein